VAEPARGGIDAHVYRRLVGARIRGDWQYRTSFLLFLAAQFLVAAVDLAAIGVLFANVDALAGWSVAEVVALYGISGVAFGVADLFISQVEQASKHIKAGTFDQFLIRPVSPLLQLSATEFALRRAGRMIQPAVALAVALVVAEVRWTPDRILLLPLALFSATCIFAAVWVLTSSIAFWTVETQEVGNAFTYGGNALTTYPIDVFGGWLRRIVVFVVPLAFVAYLPAAHLFDKPLPLGLPVRIVWLTPAVAGVFVALAAVVWRFAIRHYRSTGS
jgi:ABC-2 type transport system permease protein